MDDSLLPFHPGWGVVLALEAIIVQDSLWQGDHGQILLVFFLVTLLPRRANKWRRAMPAVGLGAVVGEAVAAWFSVPGSSSGSA